jgi:hypothetical protein
MTQKPRNELSLIDIKFLKGIAEIEQNPNEVPDTDKSEVPANTSSLRHVTDLERGKIRYRMKPQEDGGRGFQEIGYARLHPPATLDKGRIGPRSIELTDQGRKAIMSWEKRHGEVDHEELNETTKEDIELEIANLRGKVEELETRVELGDSDSGGVGSGEEVSFEGEGEVDIEEEFKKIRSQLDALSDRVDKLRENPWGAVDDSKVGEMQRTQQLAVAAGQLFVALGVDKPQNAHREDFDYIEAVHDIQERLGTQGIVAGMDKERPAHSEEREESEQSGSDAGESSKDDSAQEESTEEDQTPPEMVEDRDPFDRLE